MFIIPKLRNNEILKQDNRRKNEDKTENKYINVLTPISFFSLNEIEISQRILKIPNYSIYFNPILKNSYVNLAEIDDENFERFNEIINENDNLIVKRRNINNCLTFFDTFYSSKRENPKKYWLTLINAYKHLLEAIKTLNDANVVNLNFHPSTLVFNNNLPVLIDLSKFFHIPTMNKERISNLFSNYNSRNVFLPTEAHLICFLIENGNESISNANIEDIINDCGQRVGSLNCFTKAFIEEYKETARFSLQSFINKPKILIIQEILQNSSTWNGYGLSMLFLVLLRDIIKPCEEFKKNEFISKFNQLLTQGIHPIPDKRLEPKQNISLFNDILYNTNKPDFFQLLRERV